MNGDCGEAGRSKATRSSALSSTRTTAFQPMRCAGGAVAIGSLKTFGDTRPSRSHAIAARAPSLRGDRVNLLGRGDRLCLAAPEPCLQAIEIEVNDRRGVEGQKLAERQTTDHGIAQRLAYFRAGAM